MTILNPYIHFLDNAREAMDFYHSVLGGELKMSTFEELHGSDDPIDKDRIMHAELETPGGLHLMASDTPNHMDYTPGSSIEISLSGTDEAELTGYWNKLSEGAKEITAPFEKAPWGDIFGMCVDKFGIGWLVNVSAGTMS